MSMKPDKKELSSSLNALAKTSIAVLIGLALSKIFTYTFRIVAARFYGPEAYGLFSISLIILGWFAAFASFGLSEGLLRYVSIYKSRKQDMKARSIMRKSLIFMTLSGIIAGGIMFALAGAISNGIFHTQALEAYIKIFSIGVPLTTIAAALLSGIRAFEKVQAYSAIYNILQNLTKIAFLGAFVWFGVGALAINISYAAGLAIVLIASYIYARSRLPSLFVGKSEDAAGKAWKEVLSYSWPLMLYGIVSTIMYWVDSFSIGYFKDATAVGWYNAAVPVALLIGLSSEIFSSLFFPMVNRFYAQRKMEMIRQLGKQVTKWIFAVNMPLLAICIIFPEAVINVLFGSEYLPAAMALRLLSIGSLISTLGVVPMQLVSMAGKSKVIMADIAITAALNFLLNMWLVPMERIWMIDNSTGINGAAVATMISLAALNFLYFAQARRYTGIMPLRKKMLNIIISAALPFAGLAAVRILFDPNLLGVIIAGIAFTAVYALLLYATWSIDSHDWEIIRKILGKAGIRISEQNQAIS